MPDLDLSVTVSRTLLGLTDLELNDHVAYAINRDTGFLGGSESWQRNQVGGPWVDGMVTVSRQRQMVEETVPVYVYGATTAVLTGNSSALLAAFRQSDFVMTVRVGGVVVGQYACEASDVQRASNGYHWMAKMESWTFTVPRQPILLGGPV